MSAESARCCASRFNDVKAHVQVGLGFLMSKQNKVNKDHYVQRGRLTPDELARERAKEIYVSDSKRKFTARTKQTPTQHDESVSSPARSEPAEEE